MKNNQTLLKMALKGIVAGTVFVACQNSASEDTKCSTGTQALAKASISDTEFQQKCLAAGGMAMKQECAGNGSCAGTSLREGILVDHECAGKSECAGINCKGAKVSASTASIQKPNTVKEGDCI